MKKILITALLTLSTFALAEEVKNADCNQVMLSSLKDGKVTYKTLPVFPKPSDLTSVSFEEAPVTICGITVKKVSDNVSTASAKDFATLLKGLNFHFAKDGIFNVELYQKTGYEYPAIRAGFWVERASLEVNTKTGKVGKFVDFSPEPLFKQNTVAYRINGGELKPIIFDGKFTPFTFNPKTTNTLDFYVIGTGIKPEDMGPERWQYDFKNATFTIWKKYDFPAK